MATFEEDKFALLNQMKDDIGFRLNELIKNRPGVLRQKLITIKNFIQELNTRAQASAFEYIDANMNTEENGDPEIFQEKTTEDLRELHEQGNLVRYLEDRRDELAWEQHIAAYRSKYDWIDINKKVTELGDDI